MAMDDLIAAQLFSLIAAVVYAISNINMNYGLRTATPFTSTLVLALFTLGVYGPIAWATTSFGEIRVAGVWIFLIAGVASPGLGRTLLTMSVRGIGLSRSVTITNGAPLFSVLIAVAALGERPTALVYLGTMLIVGGVSMLSYNPRSAARGEAGRKSAWSYFLMAVLSSVLLGVSFSLRKAGISILPSLSFGLSATAVGTLTVLGLWCPFLPPEERLRVNRRDFGHLLSSALFTSLAQLSMFAAVQRGPVATAAPLISTTPLFTLALSWVLFREAERINLRLAAGVALVCAGAALVTVSRT